jgi:hypothetical protein
MSETFESLVQKPAPQETTENHDPLKDYRGGIGDKFGQAENRTQPEGAQQAAEQSEEVKKMLGEFKIDDDGKSDSQFHSPKTNGNKRGQAGP